MPQQAGKFPPWCFTWHVLIPPLHRGLESLLFNKTTAPRRKLQPSMRLTQFSERSLKDHRYKFKRVFVHILNVKDVLLSHFLKKHRVKPPCIRPASQQSGKSRLLLLVCPQLQGKAGEKINGQKSPFYHHLEQSWTC